MDWTDILSKAVFHVRRCFTRPPTTGSQLTSQVTELVVGELLWLNYAGGDKPINLYINSVGSQNIMGEVRAELGWLPCPSLADILRSLPSTCCPGAVRRL